MAYALFITRNDIIKKSQDLEFSLVSSDKKDSKRHPQAPFTTSTLQQEASRKF
jgi:DNA topoisomerase-1